MSTAELAPLLGVDPVTVRDWARSGRIPSVRTIGGRRRAGSYRFTLAHVRAILRALGLPARNLEKPTRGGAA